MSRKTDDWIQAYLEYTKNSEPPRLYKEWTAVSTIAAVLQRKVYLEWDARQYPNFYIVLVGPAGKTRKGTAMRPAQSMLREMGGDVNMAAEAITREALIRELRNSNSTSHDPETGIQMHCSLTIFSKELTVFLGYNNRQLMSDLADWYDCDPSWTYRTKGAGTDEITGVWVNLIGATTPELLQSTLPQDAIGGGLTSRIVFVYEEDKGKLVSLPFRTEEEEEIKTKLMIDLQDIAMINGEFDFVEDFYYAWDTWYKEQEEDPPFDDPKLSSYLSRRPMHVMKLSMVMSASRASDRVITLDDFGRALSLLKRTERNMAKVFQGVGRSDLAQVTTSIMSLIGRKGETTVAKLMEYFRADLDDKRELDRILQSLEMTGFCEIIHTEQGTKVRYSKGDRD